MVRVIKRGGREGGRGTGRKEGMKGMGARLLAEPDLLMYFWPEGDRILNAQLNKLGDVNKHLAHIG